MLSLHYIIWNPSLELFRLGFVAVRWYSLMIILTFLGGMQLCRYIFKKEGRPEEDVDKFSFYVLCCTLIGARLGEVFFYRPAYYLKHPLEALLPITLTPHFQFVGYRGLSYHGALLGGIVALYLYANYRITFSLLPFRFQFARQQRSGQNFFWLLTPLAFGVLMGFLVRIGNFINSEIVGTPTHSQYGVLFVSNVVERLQNSSNAIKSVKVFKNHTAKQGPSNYQPIILKLTLNNAGFEESAIKRFIKQDVKRYLVADHDIHEHVYEPAEHTLDYTLTKNRKQAYVAQIKTFGIPRHPVQLYESLSYLLTLVGLFYWWNRKPVSYF
ncbi:MAG: prolipoprotein diacylglyceryl transferase [Bacteroidota bacterium]